MTIRKLGLALAIAATAGTAAVIPAANVTGQGRTIRYLSSNPRNTDLDLGAPGGSTGDQQAFVNDALRGGKKIGYEAGVCQVVLRTPTRLIASCSETLSLPGGTLTAQGVFTEDPRVGPAGLTLAITGGTRRYHGSSGQAHGVFVQGTDDIRVTVRLD
jgi:hypothetical protein